VDIERADPKSFFFAVVAAWEREDESEGDADGSSDEGDAKRRRLRSRSRGLYPNQCDVSRTTTQALG
jgi:hypothetical protein